MQKIFFIYLILIFPFVLSAQCFENLFFREGISVGMMPDGSIWGWGGPNWGGLGPAVPLGINAQTTPVQVGTETDWKKVFVGPANTFAIKNDGTLWGTGKNTHGALGVNSNAPIINSFQQITTANNWLKVSASKEHTLALKTDGTIWGWGRNDWYQLGVSPARLSQLYPVQIGADSNWIDIEAGQGDASFALKTDGTIWGWGVNIGSIIVSGTPPNSVAYPTQVGTDNDWLKMSVGGQFILAQKTDSTLWAWGGGLCLRDGRDTYSYQYSSSNNYG